MPGPLACRLTAVLKRGKLIDFASGFFFKKKGPTKLCFGWTFFSNHHRRHLRQTLLHTIFKETVSSSSALVGFFFGQVGLNSLSCSLTFMCHHAHMIWLHAGMNVEASSALAPRTLCWALVQQISIFPTCMKQ